MLVTINARKSVCGRDLEQFSVFGIVAVLCPMLGTVCATEPEVDRALTDLVHGL